jgi:hypothetical protein
MIFARFFVVLGLSFCVGNSFSQRPAIGFSQRVGMPTEKFDEASMLRARYDIGSLACYQFKLLKNNRLWIYSSVEFARTRHDYIFSRNMYSQVMLNNKAYTEVIDVTTNRYSFHLGLRQNFSVMNDLIELGFGIGMVKRFYPNKEKAYSIHRDLTDEYNTDLEILFITLHDGKHTEKGFVSYNRIVNMEAEAFVQFNLFENSSLRFNFAYSRNNYIYYLNKLRQVTNHNNGVSTVSILNGYVGENGSKKFTRNHFLYFGVTFNYFF